MREIKFKVWDKHNEKWVYETVESICQSIYFNDTSALNLPNSTCDDEMPEIFCQFTGLVDKNGKEIYEGDIVNMFTSKDKSENKCIGFIVFEKGHYLIKWINKNSDGWGRGIIEGWLKVIGNIYENPEILTHSPL